MVPIEEMQRLQMCHWCNFDESQYNQTHIVKEK